MKKHLFILISLILPILFVSCNRNRVYEKNIEIPNSLWNKNYMTQYEFTIDKIDIPYNIYVNVRHSEMFASRNLWLFVTTTSVEGKTQRDTLNCTLADETGKWLGSGMGDIFDIQIPFKKKIGFPIKGMYKINIEHGMRMENLPLISEIGLRVEMAGK